MLRSSLLRISLPLALALAVLGCSQQPKEEGAPSSASESPLSGAPFDQETAEAPQSGEMPAAEEAIAAFEAERQRLDETVWAAEVLAQEYEKAFIHLWDDLRHVDAPGRPAVLTEFPFTEISLGNEQARASLGLGIQMRRLGGKGRVLSHAEWQEFVQQMRDAGYVLEQSEFHHQEFTPSDDGSKRSKVSVELHVANGEKRWIVRGKIQVTWSDETSPEGYTVPDRIDATNLQILEREGAKAFEPYAFFDESGEVQPVLLNDLDDDGDCDVVLAGCNAVYWNLGDGAFERSELCKYPTSGVMAAVLADLDGDAIMDLATARPNDYPLIYKGSRFRSSKASLFEEPGEVMRLPQPLVEPQAISAGDIDGDGDLDLYLAQYRSPYIGGQMPTPYYDANDGYPSYLLRNDGEAKFTDVTQSAGLGAKRFRRTYTASFVDLDDDGDQDLMVCSDFSGIDLYLNDGKGRFADVTSSHIDERANFGMSHVFGDFNGDARLDFFVLGMSSTTARRLSSMGLGREGFDEHQENRMRMGYGNRMYLNTGNGYQQAAWNDQLARSGWSWGVANLDFDNDGDLDLYVANGHQSRESAKDYCTTFWCHDIYTGSSEPDLATSAFFEDLGRRNAQEGVSWNGFEHNAFFFNSGDQGFVNVHYLLGVGFEFDSRAVLSEDFDADGFVDLLVVEAESLIPGSPRGEKVHILRNGLQQKGNWVGVDLERGPGGLSPVGAKIRVTTHSGRVLVCQQVTGESFRAQNSWRHHFGLGEGETPASIEIIYSDGSRERWNNPPGRTYHSASAIASNSSP